MKKIVNAFTVPVLEAIFPNIEQLNTDLNNHVSNLFSNMKDKRLLSYEWDNNILTDQTSPSTGWSSFNHSNLKDDPNFSSLYDLLSPLINDFFDQLGFYGDWDFVNSWANVYPKNSFVPHHNHGDVHWSGVYYINADENCGDLFLLDPKEYALSNEPFNTKWRGNHKLRITPVPGKVVLFPGYLKHESAPNKNDSYRTIISFNINCK